MFDEAIAKLKRRISLVVIRGVLNNVKDDPTSIMQISAFAKVIIGDSEFFQPYGHASHPHPGAEILSLAVGANNDHSIIIMANDKRYKIPLEEGEAAVYTSWGDKIHFQKNNITEIKTKKLIINSEDEVSINTKDFKVNASIKAMFTTPMVQASANVIATAQMAAGAYVPMAGAASIAMAGKTEVTGELSASGNITSAGNVSDQKGSMDQIRATYNGHKHVIPGPVPDQQM
jgi:phage baseplate assembly protein V